jgi:hypothetical protein
MVAPPFTLDPRRLGLLVETAVLQMEVAYIAVGAEKNACCSAHKFVMCLLQYFCIVTVFLHCSS